MLSERQQDVSRTIRTLAGRQQDDQNVSRTEAGQRQSLLQAEPIEISSLTKVEILKNTLLLYIFFYYSMFNMCMKMSTIFIFNKQNIKSFKYLNQVCHPWPKKVEIFKDYAFNIYFRGNYPISISPREHNCVRCWAPWYQGVAEKLSLVNRLFSFPAVADGRQGSLSHGPAD